MEELNTNEQLKETIESIERPNEDNNKKLAEVLLASLKIKSSDIDKLYEIPMEDTIELPRGQVKIMVGYIEKARDMLNNLLSISEQIFYKCLENTSAYYYPGEKMYELIESVKKKLEK